MHSWSYNTCKRGNTGYLRQVFSLLAPTKSHFDASQCYIYILLNAISLNHSQWTIGEFNNKVTQSKLFSYTFVFLLYIVKHIAEP